VSADQKHRPKFAHSTQRKFSEARQKLILNTTRFTLSVFLNFMHIYYFLASPAWLKKLCWLFTFKTQLLCNR